YSPDWRQWSALYQSPGCFRDAIDACVSCLGESSGAATLLRGLTASTGFGPEGATRTAGDELVAAFILQLALAQFWMAMGLSPAAVAGYGLGELTGACAAGV